MPKLATTHSLADYPRLPISQYRDQLRQTKGKVATSVSLSYAYRGNDYRYTINVTTTPANYGGYRYWWLCPKCGKRVGVLYCAGMYVCRHCLGLNYYSQHKHTYQRPDNRMNSIRKRLGWDKNPYKKPKGMHYKTYERLFMEYHEIESYYMDCLTKFDGITDVKRLRKSVKEIF